MTVKSNLLKMTEKKRLIIEWVNTCPEDCFVYEDEDGTIIIEIKLDD